jgi:hypothetical protein
MIVTTPYQPSLALVCSSGLVRKFSSLQTAIRVLGWHWILTNVGSNFRPACLPLSFLFGVGPPTASFVLLTEGGGTISPHTLATIYMDEKRTRWAIRLRSSSKNNARAIPGTGKPKAGTGTFRRIRHMNARRGAETFGEEGEVPTRGKRNQNNLPDPWDDYCPSSSDHNCWKQYRKQQWRLPKKRWLEQGDAFSGLQSCQHVRYVG